MDQELRRVDQELKSFLVELAINPRKLAEYDKDRESYLGRAGLSPEAREAVLSGDQRRIAQLIDPEWAARTKDGNAAKHLKRKRKPPKKKPAKKRKPKK